MSLLTLTQVDGVTVFVASNQVVAIRQDAANPTTRCYVTMQGIETPVYVQSFWATLVVTVDAELSNQYVELLTTGEQVSLSLDYVYQLRPDPSSPLSRTMVVMGAQGTPFMVKALASVLAAAMQSYMAGLPFCAVRILADSTIVYAVNVGSITQYGTGDYVANLTVGVPADKRLYVIVSSGDSTPHVVTGTWDSGAPEYVGMRSYELGGTPKDSALYMIGVVGDAP